MKLFELFSPLMEAQNYEDMFNSISKYTDTLKLDYEPYRSDIERHISWARKVLKKNDRIVWYLRLASQAILLKIVDDAQTIFRKREYDEQYMNYADVDFVPIFASLEKAVDKMSQKTGATVINTTDLRKYNEELEHFMSLAHVGKIQNHVWSNERPQYLFDLFAKYENDWRESIGHDETTVDLEEDDKEIINFGNQGWWLLDRESCGKEGKAMGHCGNIASPRQGDRILSFRTRLDNDIFRPHLTFILREGNILGEMKGRANEKPTKKYHKFIIELLKHDIVEGIVGGGHAPEDNFEMSDLSQQQYDEVVADKPVLMTFADHYEFVTNARDLDEFEILIERLQYTVEAHGINVAQVNNHGIILAEYSDFATMVEQIGDNNLGNMIGVTNGTVDLEFDINDYADTAEFLKTASPAQRRLITEICKEKISGFMDMFAGERDILQFLFGTWEEYSPTVEVMDAIMDAVERSIMYSIEETTRDAFKEEIHDTLTYFNQQQSQIDTGMRITMERPFMIYLPVRAACYTMDDPDQIEGLHEMREPNGYYFIVSARTDSTSLIDFDESLAHERFTEELEDLL